MTLVYVWSFLSFCATLIGAAVLFLNRDWSRLNIWRILAFGSGVLLGVSFVHILPEANHMDPHLAGLGVLTSFFLIFSIEGFTMMHSCLEYAEECSIHFVGWTAFGALALHSLIDGMAIAIAFQKKVVLGQVVASAILIHKLTDGLTLTGILMSAQYSAKKCLQIVSLLALATPLGVFLFMPVTALISNSFMGWLFGFIAGTFFYVGAADILPRLHKIKDYYCLGSFALGRLLGGARW